MDWNGDNLTREPLPLAGLRVVALEQAVAAPFCSRQLCELGADVIKIERPADGDFSRGYDAALHGVSAYFAWLNRGKRSVVLDLKTDSDRTALRELVARADVFLHNLAVGAVERLGLDYAALRLAHPRLIWCGISGYGPDGPYCGRKAYDLLVQAEAGVISITGAPGAPAKVGVSVADIASGHYAYSSILAALLRRQLTGRGGRIDISMFECLVEWMMPTLSLYQGTGAVAQPAGMRHHMVVPYGVFDCADGAVVLAVQSQPEWVRFCEGLMTPELAAEDRFGSNALRVRNRAALEPMIAARLRTLTQAEAIAALERAEIAYAALNDVPAVVGHPQLAARARWTEVASPVGAIPALIPPHNLMQAPPRMGPVPALGQHTEEVLRELRTTPDML